MRASPERCQVLWAIALLALISLAACTRETPTRRLNVLLIVLDTTRADALGVSGSANTHTPHMDQLAREGVVFTHARSTSAWTVPSHGSLFTGLYPSNHGAHHEHPRLDSGQVTLAEILTGSHQTAVSRRTRSFSGPTATPRDSGISKRFGASERTGASPREPWTRSGAGWRSEIASGSSSSS